MMNLYNGQARATEGVRRMYEENDLVDEAFLNEISKGFM